MSPEHPLARGAAIQSRLDDEPNCDRQTSRPWHTIPPLLQYVFMVPLYIAVLNVYVVCPIFIFLVHT